MLQQDTGLRLGPAVVSRAAGRRVLLRRADSAADEWAELALAFPYQPAAGDVVLAVSQEERRYVIGVLQGRGPSVLSFPGDVVLSAPQGTMRLDAGKGVTVSAPSVELRADAIELEARTLTQRIESAYQWVKDLLQVRAGRTSTVVEASSHHLAERTFIRSEKETKVDGEKIYLG
ncbi:MAG TPA: DUF3540 domain-containing protein [Planctomycetota bacterium]|nr:DUF3540 domain-containing protein [Planctomycetota bacterium]